MQKMVDGEIVDMTEDEIVEFEVSRVPLPPQLEDFRAAVQARIDTEAQTKQYENGLACATYATSTIPGWAAQAQAFVAWRDAVWAYAFTELAKVESGEREQPSVAEIIDELPAISWPE